MDCGRPLQASNFERRIGTAPRIGRFLSKERLNFPAHLFVARVAILAFASFGTPDPA
jgi:hypothetical protein